MSSHTYSLGKPSNDRTMRRVAAGIALSIAAHGLVLFALRYRAPTLPAQAPAQQEMLVIHLRAPSPPPEQAPQPEPVQATATPRKPATAKPAPARRVTEVIAIPAATPDRQAEEPAFTVAPPQKGTDSPTFDPDAARKFARDIATRPDPARAGMAVAQIPEKPLPTESKYARAIASAKRGDCKDIPANLLTPLLMLLDKKDSGCKW